MKRRAWMKTGLGLGLLPFVSEAAARLQWRDITFTGLGTVLSIRAAHQDLGVLEQALQQAKQVIARIEDQMSLFRPDSAIRQLNREGVLRTPAPDLLHVLQRSQQFSAQSQGAFDITVQPLWRVFEQAKAHGALPDAREVAAATRQVGWQRLAVDAREVRFLTPGMGITLNGIAQGYAADRVRETLKQAGIAHALINTGEWSSLGQSAHAADWSLGVADPRQDHALLGRLSLRGRCVATSADALCAFSEDRRHHHIFDPHTGYSPTDLASVTVAASSCLQADALTKVLFVAGFEKALALAKAWRVDALVVHKSGRWKASEGLRWQSA
jgi:FAD:protein FMN transferase